MPRPQAQPIDRYAVIGHPVAHSRSPLIHRLFAQATGQAIAYERIEAPLEGFAAVARQFAADGGRGCNVTVPFKFEAFALCQRHTPRAVLAGAVNTIGFDADGWLGDNTDGAGLVRDITVNARVALAGRRVLLIGAGGAAAGVLGPLIEAAPAAITLANRTASRAEALAERHAKLALTCGVNLIVATLAEPGRAFDVLLNASASSLAGQATPVPDSALGTGALAVDLMYGAVAEPFLAWARARGAQARDGLGMLVEQAAQAFALWRGVQPATAPVLAALTTLATPSVAPPHAATHGGNQR